MAYSTFANGGMRYDPVMLTTVRNRDGFVIYDYREFAKKERAMSEPLAYVMTYLMEGVVKWGSGSRARDLERPCAGKTGTTNRNSNVWFCGFTPQLTAVVWLGYKEDTRSLGRGTNYTGGRLACPVWTDFMIKAHEALHLQILEFEPPEQGVVFYNIDKATGLLGGTFREAFLTGTRPATEMPTFEEDDNIIEITGQLLLENL